MGISYQWQDGVTGDWQVATNWNPVGVPGSSDFATIGHASNNTAQTVTGTGAAFLLNCFATTTLAGTFSVVHDLTTDFEFGSLTIDGASLAVGGNLTAYTLSLNVKNGAVVQTAGLVVGADCSLGVDAASSMAIGSSASATAGQLTIAPGVAVSVLENFSTQARGGSKASLSAPTIVNDGAISMTGTTGVAKTLVISGSNLIDNGTINVTDGQLQILESNGVGGTGSINIGSNSTFVAGYFGPDTRNTVHFRGTTDNLNLTNSSLDTSKTFDPVVYGFNDSDVIALRGLIPLQDANSTGASIAYTPSSGVSTLNLLDGAQAVASIKLAGNYSAFPLPPVLMTTPGPH